jgi:catechol 2,3-dioxygenase-like lactoylglutathione lyase family enzyme
MRPLNHQSAEGGSGAYAPAMADLRVLISANDYAETLAFYGDVLGFSIAESWDDPDGRGTLFRAADGFIEVFEANEHHPAHAVEGVRLGIEVADAQALHDRVVARGVGSLIRSTTARGSTAASRSTIRTASR